MNARTVSFKSFVLILCLGSKMGLAAAVQAGLGPAVAAAAKVTLQRVTSFYLAQDFINEQLKALVRPGLLNEMTLDLDPKTSQMQLRGLAKVPVEEMKAVNLDPSLGAYRFQVTIKPQTTPDGYLILEFPLNETFFYPALSKNPKRDRVIVPVQMLSLALASARGYFAALSGDFSSLDRKTAKLKAQVHALNVGIKAEHNVDALDELQTERDSLKLQLAAIPLERKQLKKLSAQLAGFLKFTGEKELNLNDEFMARQNALILKLDLGRMVPFLNGVELGGVRILHDAQDGPHGENFLAIDIHALLNQASLEPKQASVRKMAGMKTAPSAVIRVNQTLFESELILAAEKKSMGEQLRDLQIDLREDGLHVLGKYHKFFINILFDAVVDVDSMDPDTFEVSMRDIEIAGLDLEFLSGWVLESVKNRLDQTLKGICTFEYVGEKKDNSRVLLVKVDPAKLAPAMPGLHLVDVEIRDREFLLKIGKLQ